ncbi:prenyltransferase/squalene oxidase repeat-containing protein [Spirosoma sp. 209]|uniref:prenyltransferase/squalene oxidase repeat-containing protein n=1 Tax=Spirosoma sp. 209 TaxID=1955701 RepID=UPI00098D3250|nr:prenyltransferase/squalene oxidase repeat-containing protein [Spirosoma sp. 209]
MRKNFTERIEALPVDTRTKALLSREKTQQKHIFYLNLIDYLLPLFERIANEQKEQVSFAGYLYFRFLLEFDDIIDTSAHKDKLAQLTQLKYTFELHEAAIRELAALFPTSSPFWPQFAGYKHEYEQAVLAEKQVSHTRQPFSEQTYEQLAAGKSAVCYAALLALSTLNGGQAGSGPLETCLRHIHIAFQYLDDISDFKTDMEQQQWTFAQQLVHERLAGRPGTSSDHNVLHKQLYLSGVASDLIGKAMAHYQAAIGIADRLQLIDLSAYLHKQRSLARLFGDEVRLLVQKARLKATQSHFRRPRSGADESIQAALGYLMANRTNTGWTDFMTSAGAGDTWISAYVAFMLADCGIDSPLLDKTLRHLSTTGSFNDTILQDGDSTNFLVGLHQRLTGMVPAELRQNWLAFTSERGGWTTYLDEIQLRQRLDLDAQTSVAGWFADHDCVTAAAAYILSDLPDLPAVYNATCRYLATRLASTGLQAYWWTSNVYALSFSALAFAGSGAYRSYGCQVAQQIARQQESDGYWNNPADGQPNAFYTAIALKALLATDPLAYRASIDGAAQWLMNNQMADGSWQTGRILRIPATNVRDPATVSHWRHSSFGVNTLVDDHARVFTTSTVLNALRRFVVLNTEPSCSLHPEPASMNSIKVTGLSTLPKGVTSS